MSTSFEEFKERLKPKYYDMEGKPLTLEEWATSFEGDQKKRILKQTTLNGVLISTVWVGLDMNTFPELYDTDKPVIFETMVFPFEESRDDRHTERYCTKEEALEGHMHVCEMLRRGEIK